MGSLGHDGTTLLNVTGFGRFQGVENNPTSDLIGCMSLSTSLKLPEGCILDSCEVFETSTQGAGDGLGNLYVRCANTRCKLRCACDGKEESGHGFFGASEHVPGCPASACQQVVVHLGLDGRTTHFKLESMAWNEATFRCPDERGFQPVKQLIVTEGDRGLDHSLITTLPIHRLKDRLAAQGFHVEISHDPGRFVCNYVYYKSLELARRERAPVHALFVHVPPFSVVPRERQLEFLSALFATVHALVHPCA
eukprot:tig00021179_g19217.t1